MFNFSYSLFTERYFKISFKFGNIVYNELFISIGRNKIYFREGFSSYLAEISVI